MTGFYLYFAITKREFSLGTWRERIIEVILRSWHSQRTASKTLIAGEKEAAI
jgi:hypothetical protein